MMSLPKLAMVALTVRELERLPFVQRAIRNPSESPHSVLSFFFGVDTTTNDGRETLQQGTQLKNMLPIWFGSDPEYDALCRSFASVVRAAGKRELRSWDDPTTTADPVAVVDGMMAQLLLTDQIARNAFRGTSEAYAYENRSLELSRTLAKMAMSSILPSDAESNVHEHPTVQPEKLNPSYLAFIAVALTHSEVASDHETCQEILQDAQRKATMASLPNPILEEWWNIQLASLEEHRQVVDRFGRYPHRNQLYGRESTPEEMAWLEDKEHLPGWAKSQES
jgi:uncharacterized protein (DUF924 family)